MVARHQFPFIWIIDFARCPRPVNESPTLYITVSNKSCSVHLTELIWEMNPEALFGVESGAYT